MTQRFILTLVLLVIVLLALLVQNIAEVIIPSWDHIVSSGFVILVVHQFHDVFTRLAKDRFALIG